jgi:small subunit ribosomal protein S5
MTKFASSKVMLRPATPGTGVIAGRGVRPVVEAAGIRDLLSKAYGSNNPVNVVKATFKALSELIALEDMARRRDLTPHELWSRIIRRETAPDQEHVA